MGNVVIIDKLVFSLLSFPRRNKYSYNCIICVFIGLTRFTPLLCSKTLLTFCVYFKKFLIL